MKEVDVIIVGAGLSGIGAACHLQRECPDRSFVILEARDAIGGTWDLFRYPGVRSDSDMHTLGYDFKPWTDAKAIADGPAILDYVEETARENGLMERIRFGHRVRSARWDGSQARWTVRVYHDGNRTSEISGNFLYMCSGYYEYEGGHSPHFDGQENFGGRILHPQFWPEGLDHAGKRVVIIGSGATAMTLAPAMANSGASVTMVQRSPTYVISRPDVDALANSLGRWLPAKLAYAITRWKNIAMQQACVSAHPGHGWKTATCLSDPGSTTSRPGTCSGRCISSQAGRPASMATCLGLRDRQEAHPCADRGWRASARQPRRRQTGTATRGLRRVRGQRPTKRGSRFSTNARKASRESSLPPVRECRSVSSSM